MRISEFIRNLPTEGSSSSNLADWEALLGRQLDPDEKTVLHMWGDTMVPLMAEVVQNEEVEGEADGPDDGGEPAVALRTDREPCFCSECNERRRINIENKSRKFRNQPLLSVPESQPHARVPNSEGSAA